MESLHQGMSWPLNGLVRVHSVRATLCVPLLPQVLPSPPAEDHQIECRWLSWACSAPFSPWSHQNENFENWGAPFLLVNGLRRLWSCPHPCPQKQMQKILDTKCPLSCQSLWPTPGLTLLSTSHGGLPLVLECALSTHSITLPLFGHRASICYQFYCSVHYANFHYWWLACVSRFISLNLEAAQVVTVNTCTHTHTRWQSHTL